METAKAQRQPKRWTADEDVVLHEEATKQASSGNIKDWNRIAEKLPGRTNKDCRKRWINKVCGGLKRGTWSEPEDQMLREAVALYGQRWTKVAQKCDGRSPDQCAKRWQFTLDPKLEHREWTAEEDTLLLRLVDLVGRDWKFICSNHYPTRSRNDLKNRHTILSRKSISNGSTSGADEADAQPLKDVIEVRIDNSTTSDANSAADGQTSQDSDMSNLAGEHDESSSWMDDVQPEQPDNHEAFQDGVSLLDLDMDFQPGTDFFELFPESDPGIDKSGIVTQGPSTTIPSVLDFSIVANHNALSSTNMEITPTSPPTEPFAKESYVAQNTLALDISTGFGTPLTVVGDGNAMQVMGFPNNGCDSSVSKVVLVVEECNTEMVKYLIDMSRQLKGKVKLEMTV